MRRSFLVVVLGAVAAFGTSGQAGAATTLGQTFVPDGGTCLGSPDVEIMQVSRGDGTPYAAPTAGVLTSWSFQVGSQVTRMTLRVYRPASTAGDFTVIAEDGPLKTIPASSGVHKFGVRIPVQPGDLIGVRGQEGGCGALTGDPDDDLFVNGGGVATPVGQTGTYSPGMVNGIVDISAQLEPDADGDGFGDETQDACPGNASLQVECVAPETSLTKGPKKKTTKRKVKFAFSSDDPAATFECKLDRKPFKACTSPRKARVGLGKHKFKVRAVDAAGNVDSTPAKVKFKVVP